MLVNVNEPSAAEAKYGGGGGGRDTSRTHSEIGAQTTKEMIRVGSLVVLRCEIGYLCVDLRDRVFCWKPQSHIV